MAVGGLLIGNTSLSNGESRANVGSGRIQARGCSCGYRPVGLDPPRKIDRFLSLFVTYLIAFAPFSSVLLQLQYHLIINTINTINTIMSRAIE